MQHQISSLEGANPTPVNAPAPVHHFTVGASLAIALLFPLSIGITITSYRKYQKNRLQRQIAKLERIWNLTHRR